MSNSDQSKPHDNSKFTGNNGNPNYTSDLITSQAKNESSLVRSNNDKSLIPYINDILVLPLQKPFFPGFKSILQINSNELKKYLILNYVLSLANKTKHVDWIGLFLLDPSTRINNGHKTDESILVIQKNNEQNNDNEIEYKTNPDGTIWNRFCI